MATVKCWGLVVWLHITGAMCAGVLLAQTIEIPRVWLTVSPKEVLADIDFHRLPMRDRQRIMSEVDPDFRGIPAL